MRKVLKMIKFSLQKSILTLVLVVCPAILGLDGKNELKIATRQAFAAKSIKPLEDLCLQELNSILELTEQGDDISNLNKLVKARVTGIYTQLVTLANNHVKAGNMSKAIALLNGLYSKLHEYADSSAWGNLLIQASPALQESLAE